MFGKAEPKGGGKLQEAGRSGNTAGYDYFPEGSRKPARRVKACDAVRAEDKLLQTGILSYDGCQGTPVGDVKPLTADAKKPVDPYAEFK